jgi:methionyl aminopeptidase
MIVLRNREEISEIRKAGSIAALALARIKKAAKPGVMTAELDRIALDEITKHKALAAFKDYRGYPANICTSINEGVVHGIPGSRRLDDGDILSVDVGVRYGNFFADAAVTVAIGAVSDEAKKLIKVTEESFYRGIENARPGKRLSDISAAVQRHVESNGFSVVRMFVGHGIGEKIHEEPEIPNFGPPGRGALLEPGMVLAIEPMVNAGSFEVEILEDGWTAVTKDGSLSAHYEHTIAITDAKPEILTSI